MFGLTSIIALVFGVMSSAQRSGEGKKFSFAYVCNSTGWIPSIVNVILVSLAVRMHISASMRCRLLVIEVPGSRTSVETGRHFYTTILPRHGEDDLVPSIRERHRGSAERHIASCGEDEICRRNVGILAVAGFHFLDYRLSQRQVAGVRQVSAARWRRRRIRECIEERFRWRNTWNALRHV